MGSGGVGALYIEGPRRPFWGGDTLEEEEARTSVQEEGQQMESLEHKNLVGLEETEAHVTRANEQWRGGRKTGLKREARSEGPEGQSEDLGL